MTDHPHPIEDAIRARRSVRGLDGPPLAAEEVEALVALALTAPAPHHTRPWRFVEIGAARREVLADAMGSAWRRDLEADALPSKTVDRALARSRARITGAPTLLLGCLVADGLNRYTDERRWRAEWGLAQHSFGAALQNLLLAASARGFAAYWISAPLYAPDEVRGALDLDATWEPQAFVALGRPKGDYRPFDRPAPDLGTEFTRR
ncbi:MAG: nitroreductase family protein [Chloroflexi bacterium]|nr:nitroreductase family protein [Chloroflexota bacterium]